MSGVILRCPNCGTGRAAPGECEACHEADARYFCTNHAPGVWLDGTACPRCGAKFGQAAPAAPASPASPAAPAARPTRPTPAAPSLEEMLAEAVRAREAARPTMEPGPHVRAATRGMAGCLVRALVLLFVFILMSFSGMFMFGGSMFGGW
jgi:hypothetical protein